MFILPAIPIVKKWNKTSVSIFPPTNSTAIILFNRTLESTIGLPKITKYIRYLTYLNTFSLDIFVGIILGDATIKKGRNNTNVRISFKQSIINFPFLWTVFTNLSHFCKALPRFEIANFKGKKYGSIVVETRTYPILNVLYDLFIENGIKIIREDLFHFLSPVALAYWIMSDGVSSQYGLTICTDSFTVKEVVRLINILKIRYDLNCSLHYYAGRPRLYIKADSMAKLRSIVNSYVIPFSTYKLYKGKRFIL